MPVYHLTVHAYRSWNPDHPRGFVQRGKGYLPPDQQMADDYDARARFSRVWFDSVAIQEALILGVIDVCRRRGWRIHIVATDPTHLHWVVSWHGFLPWSTVWQKTKNVLSLLLGRLTGETGRRWFVRDGNRKRVEDLDHLHHLMFKYLPDHRGLFWREGDPFPQDTHGILEANGTDLPIDTPSPDSDGSPP